MRRVSMTTFGFAGGALAGLAYGAYLAWEQSGGLTSIVIMPLVGATLGVLGAMALRRMLGILRPKP